MFPAKFAGILSPRVMVFGGTAFEKWLGHKGRALLNGLVSSKRDPKESVLLSSAMRLSREDSYEPGKQALTNWISQHLDLGLLQLLELRNKFVPYVISISPSATAFFFFFCLPCKKCFELSSLNRTESMNTSVEAWILTTGSTASPPAMVLL